MAELIQFDKAMDFELIGQRPAKKLNTKDTK